MRRLVRDSYRTVERMTHLWTIEDPVRGHSPEARRAARRQHAAPILADLWVRWQYELSRVPGRSKLAEAIRYAIIRRAELKRFIDHRCKRSRARDPAVTSLRTGLRSLGRSCELTTIAGQKLDRFCSRSNYSVAST
jgi:hypothetical protein